jgi:hypothetical protein
LGAVIEFQTIILRTMERSIRLFLPLIFAFLILMNGRVLAQDQLAPAKAQFFTDVPSLLALRPNIGIRLASKGNWRPEMHLAFNHGTARILSPNGFSSFPNWLPFTEFFGPCVIVSGGMVKMKELPGDKARVFRLLLSAKAFQTKPFQWSDGFGECGKRDFRKFDIGPKATYGSQKWISEHLGLEWQAGLGFRLGAWQGQILEHGDLDYSCSYFNVPEGLPENSFSSLQFNFSPTLHLGVAMTFR